MRVDVHSEPDGEASSSREQARGQIERYTIDLGSKKMTEAFIDAGHERKRCEKVAAELPIRDPGLVS
jgi:hypothetical protein